jgi:cohesin complex subunit SA-1/2
MNMHILFHPTPDAPSSLAHLALELADEVQSRCADFVRAEVERYAEELEERAAADGDDEAPSGSDEDEDEETQTVRKRRRPRLSAKTNGKGKEKANGKDKANGHAPAPMPRASRAALEREYVFIGVVSTFLRALRVGAVAPRHGGVLLAHFGRLGVAFDLCAKAVVQILQDEGIRFGNGELVVGIVTGALREVRYPPCCPNAR